jgi:hypothetical protein
VPASADGDGRADEGVAVTGPPADDRAAVPAEDERAPGAAGDGGAVAPPDEPSAEDRPAADEDRAAASPDEPSTEDRPEDDEEAAPEQESARSGNGVPAGPPAEIPRATPRPQSRPAAAPLRAPAASRPATVEPSRTAAGRPGREGGSRAGLYTLVGVLVLAAAIFVPVYFMVIADDDEPAPQPNPIAEPGGSPAAGAGTQAAEVRAEKVVVVLNGTPIEGLAARERDKLLAAGYSDEQGMIRVDNNPDQACQDSVVYYRAEDRRQARDVSRLLDISRSEQIGEETQALANSSDETGTLPADVVALVCADKSP